MQAALLVSCLVWYGKKIGRLERLFIWWKIFQLSSSYILRFQTTSEQSKACSYRVGHSSRPEAKNLWNKQSQNFFREIAFLAVLKFFPVKKLILFKKIFMALIYSIPRVFFLAWTFLNFLPLCAMEFPQNWKTENSVNQSTTI